MKKTKTRLLAGLMAALCLAAVSPSASAAGYYASDESGHTRPPSAIESISISQESVSLPVKRQPNKSEALTPDGNLSLIDDILIRNTGHIQNGNRSRPEKDGIPDLTLAGIFKGNAA